MDNDTYTLLAYTPGSETPFIPVSIIVRKKFDMRFKTWAISLNGSEQSMDEVFGYGDNTPVSPPEDFPEGSWPCIEHNGISWFKIAEEARWRAERASNLLEEANRKRDPVKVLETLKTCARIAKMDVALLMSRLDASRNSPTESLVDIFERIKPNEKV